MEYCLDLKTNNYTVKTLTIGNQTITMLIMSLI